MGGAQIPDFGEILGRFWQILGPPGVQKGPIFTQFSQKNRGKELILGGFFRNFPKMSKFVQIWTKFDKICQNWTKFDKIWTNLDKFGQIWTNLDKFGTFQIPGNQPKNGVKCEVLVRERAHFWGRFWGGQKCKKALSRISYVFNILVKILVFKRIISRALFWEIFPEKKVTPYRGKTHKKCPTRKLTPLSFLEIQLPHLRYGGWYFRQKGQFWTKSPV